MKENFKCPRCKKKIIVGKRLHASYKCCKCGNQMLISRDEKARGHVNYKHNFMLTR